MKVDKVTLGKTTKRKLRHWGSGAEVLGKRGTCGNHGDVNHGDVNHVSGNQEGAKHAKVNNVEDKLIIKLIYA